MADTNHVYYGSGAPPIIYHQGKAFIGGMVDSTIKDLPDVTTSDNGKILKVIEGKWGKGDKPFNSLSASIFIINYENNLSNDTLYLVNGEINRNGRLNRNVTSSSSAITLDPPSSYVTNHEGWRAFHDEDSYGWTNHLTDGYLIYMFQDAKFVTELNAVLKWHGDFTNPHLCEIDWEYTENGTDWLDPSDTGAAYNNIFVDYTVTSSTTETETNISVKLKSTTKMLGVRFKNLYSMCEHDASSSDDWVFELHDVLIKGLAVGSDNTKSSIWYKGRCYSEVS